MLKRFPNLVIAPAASAPFLLQKSVLSKLMQALFKGALKDGELDFLQGRWLQLEVSDANLRVQISCSTKRDIVIRKSGKADVCIRGTLKSFTFLAAQKEDPDTLFFQRDLVIEGDTDLGLAVKNCMDSRDLQSLPPEINFGVRCSAEYMEAFC